MGFNPYGIDGSTLKSLTSSGSILFDVARYDSNMEKHDHLKCNICGDLIDIYKNNIDVSKTILRDFNFKVSDIEMTISGTCKKHT